MYCAAFVSSPGEGRKPLNVICRQRPHRLLYVGLERKQSAQPCRNSMPVIDQARENGRIVASPSREEDCMLSRAKNCAAIELQSNR
jgi:hypothetical protein